MKNVLSNLFTTPIVDILINKFKGLEITDLYGICYKLDEIIGKGGFGQIYSSNSYAVKIEPFDNGSLFTEIHFYMKFLKKEQIQKWMKMNELEHLGIPIFIGSGSFKNENIKYRFLILEKFEDISDNLLKYSKDLINSLEYIHSKGYIHSDIKKENIMIKNSKPYLLDYGIVTRVNFNPDKKRKNNGTLEYLSRDAHQGIISYRSDLESLCYNFIEWSGFELPWKFEKNIENVSKMKNQFMKQIPSFTKILDKFVLYVSEMKIEDIPDYKKCRSFF